MLITNEYKSLNSLSIIPTLFFYNDTYPTLNVNEPISNNQYYYADNLKLIHIKKDNTCNGKLSFGFEKLNIGDVIEVEFDLRIVSGTQFRISFNEIETISNIKTPIEKTYYEYSNTEWNTVRASYTIRNDSFSNHLVDIGIQKYIAGEWYIKNLKVNVKRQHTNELKERMESYCIERWSNSGTMEWRNRTEWYTKSGVVSELDTNTLKVTFSKPFTNKRPICNATLNYVNAGKNYRIMVDCSDSSFCKIQFYDSTNTVVPLANLGSSLLFYLIAFGID